MCRYTTQDFSVARFIKYSQTHLQKLEEQLKDVATVKVWLSNEKGSDRDRRVEYQCRPFPVSNTSAKFVTDENFQDLV